MNNESPTLHKLKTGCVRYLNAKPLLYGYDGPVVYEHPSRLAKLLANGEVDLALLSSFEALRAPEFLIADGASISSDGEVFSVFLAYRNNTNKGDELNQSAVCSERGSQISRENLHAELKTLRRILLDPASLTSAHLLQILLAEFHDLSPEYIDANRENRENSDAEIGSRIADPKTTDAQLLIGNQAIDFRLANGDRFHYLDLGAEWNRCTGLPFVYAVWIIRPDIAEFANSERVAAELRAIKADGLAHLDEIVVSESSSESRHSAEFCRSYLDGYIRYELGDREKAGLALFRELLIKHRHIPANHEPLRFV